MENNQTIEVKEKKINKFFKIEQPIMKEIYKNGFQSYVDKLKNLEKAFSKYNYSICCIDEGTPSGFHSAGSGMLRPKEEVLKSFRDAGVTEITSHEGCGAAVLYTKEHDLDPSKSDQYAIKWSKMIAEELGVNYRHISSTEMNRPRGRHIARVAYYDNTGKFDYSKVKGLPAGFIISRKIQSEKDSLAEAEVSFNIATGDHGYGDLIDKKNPFVIAVVGKNEEEILLLKMELNPIKEKLGERMMIASFLAPEINLKY